MNRKRRVARIGSAMIIGLGVVVAGTGQASAGANHAPTVSAPLAEGLAGPLQIDVGRDGKVLVGQSFSGTVSTVDRKGHVTDVFNDGAVDGVEHGREWGVIISTHSGLADPGAPPPPGFVPTAELRMRNAKGETNVLDDTLSYETANNPDAGQ